MSKVGLICVADRPTVLPVLLYALRAQTFEDWSCAVLDQGDGVCAQIANLFGDRRVWGKRVDRVGDWGQTVKMQEAMETDCQYCGFPNDDAYYAPPYLAQMVAALDVGNDLVYCDWVYDLAGYGPMRGQPRTGLVDVGGFMLRRSALEKVGWHDRTHEGDGRLVERVVAMGFKHANVPGIFYVKN